MNGFKFTHFLEDTLGEEFIDSENFGMFSSSAMLITVEMQSCMSASVQTEKIKIERKQEGLSQYIAHQQQATTDRFFFS
jgi:hypothetical protein